MLLGRPSRTPGVNQTRSAFGRSELEGHEDSAQRNSLTTWDLWGCEVGRHGSHLPTAHPDRVGDFGLNSPGSRKHQYFTVYVPSL